MDGRGVRAMVLSATFNNILDLQLPVQSVPITTKVVSSNPAYGVVFSLQLYVINFSVIYDRSVVFSGYSGFLRANKSDRQDIAEILLKVAFSIFVLYSNLSTSNDCVNNRDEVT
jgi:hypothetical protein